MIAKKNNYAFIDGQNLYLGIKKLGWRLDYHKFRVYLREKYKISKAYIFLGYIAQNELFYHNLEKAGFDLIFKPTTIGSDGKIKGNVDADLIVKTLTEIDLYEKALIVSNDGDFYSLVGYLRSIGKLAAVLSPNSSHCSWLLREVASKKIWFMNELQTKLIYKE